MSLDTFIPELWSARILDNLRNALVYANLVNRDYEGEINQFGDTVHIGMIGEVEIKDYDKSTDEIDGPDELSATDQTLKIDQAKYFNMKIKDVDRAQVRAPLMDKATSSAGYGFAAKADKYLAGLLSAGTLTIGSDATPTSVTVANAYNLLVDMKTKLDDASVPSNGRWVVVPPIFEGIMLQDTRFASAYSASAESSLKNGMIGRAAGFDIYKSNNVPNTSGAKYKIIAGTNIAGTYAEQILETEAYRPHTGFSDAVKGLHVYGAKITRPNTLAVLTANFTATP